MYYRSIAEHILLEGFWDRMGNIRSKLDNAVDSTISSVRRGMKSGKDATKERLAYAVAGEPRPEKTKLTLSQRFKSARRNLGSRILGNNIQTQQSTTSTKPLVQNPINKQRINKGMSQFGRGIERLKNSAIRNPASALAVGGGLLTTGYVGSKLLNKSDNKYDRR